MIDTCHTGGSCISYTVYCDCFLMYILYMEYRLHLARVMLFFLLQNMHSAVYLTVRSVNHTV
jgi:hypothetical protein